MLCSVRNGNLKVLYYFGNVEFVAGILPKIIKKYKIKMMTIYDDKLNSMIQKSKTPKSIYKRPLKRDYLTHKDFKEKLGKDFKFNFTDGDERRFFFYLNRLMNIDLQYLNDLILKGLNLQLSEITQIWNVRNTLVLILKLIKPRLNSESQNWHLRKFGGNLLEKRDLDGKTVPFDINDDFAFYIIAIEESENSGFFMFSNAVLEKKI